MTDDDDTWSGYLEMFRVGVVFSWEVGYMSDGRYISWDLTSSTAGVVGPLAEGMTLMLKQVSTPSRAAHTRTWGEEYDDKFGCWRAAGVTPDSWPARGTLTRFRSIAKERGL